MIKDELKIGITLSGGGVRAAVFHLGVLARLADEGLLEKIAQTSTVSGGTLITGMLYASNKKQWPTSQEFRERCLPFIKEKLTQTSLGKNALLRTLLNPWLCYFGRAKILSKSLEKCWGIKGKLNDLPTTPTWYINSCAIESGKSWRFSPNSKMGDYILKYTNKPDILLADSMCSSAAVPLLVGSLILRNKTSKRAKRKFKKIHIWDGGVYDNLGIEPLVKIKNGCVYAGELNYLIISDAAKKLETKKVFFLSRATRLLDITMDQVRSLRARMLMDHFWNHHNTGAYLKIGNTVSEILKENKWEGKSEAFSEGCLDKEKVEKAKSYGTDLWKMSESNFAMIFQHGWEVADATLVSNSPDLFSKQEFKKNNY